MVKKFDVNKAVSDYLENGYAIVDFFTNDVKKSIDEWALDWLYSLMSEDVKNKKISEYHQWFDVYNIKHDEILRAKSRHKLGNEIIDSSIIKNEYLKEFCKCIGINEYKFWDEGLGNIGFRLIRPGFNDGYPLSKKEWGIAKNVVSLWIPVIGHSEKETLLLLPGSHKKDYKGEIDQTNKFRSDELRLTNITDDMKFIRPELKENQIILFHPRLIHSEDVEKSDSTRFNLEMRLEPNNE